MKSVEPRSCADCGRTFTPKRSAKAIYCSEACNSHAYRVRRKGQSPTFGICEVEGCERRRKTKNSRWCDPHYQRWYRYGDPTADGRRPPKADGVCMYCKGASERGRMFCSSLCRNRSLAGTDDVQRYCHACEAEIPHHGHGNRIYCSEKCQRIGLQSRVYGMEAGDYVRLHMAQQGRCAVCSTVPNKLFIDHNHETGQVRGLLCTQCNVGIGMLKEDPDRLRSAISYLQGSADGLESRVLAQGSVA